MPDETKVTAAPEACPMGRTDYDECFAPFRYCPVKGCGRVEGGIQLPTETPTRDDLIRNMLDMAQKRAANAPEKDALRPETWPPVHRHYNDVRVNDCGHDLHYGWLEIAQEIENVQQVLDVAGIPDGLPQGKGDADWRAAEAIMRLLEANERLVRIAQNHAQEQGAGGMVGSYCVECEHLWPCPTYRFAHGDADTLDPWEATDGT